MPVWSRALLIDVYSWMECCHIIGVVCWFSALLYLPRLFGYHAMAQDPAVIKQLKKMERHLFHGFGTPAMILSLMSGGFLFAGFSAYFLSARWFLIKLVLVLTLVVYHALCGYFLRNFSIDVNVYSNGFYRRQGRVPVILLIGITVTSLVKPF